MSKKQELSQSEAVRLAELQNKNERTEAEKKEMKKLEARA